MAPLSGTWGAHGLCNSLAGWNTSTECLPWKRANWECCFTGASPNIIESFLKNGAHLLVSAPKAFVYPLTAVPSTAWTVVSLVPLHHLCHAHVGMGCGPSPLTPSFRLCPLPSEFATGPLLHYSLVRDTAFTFLVSFRPNTFVIPGPELSVERPLSPPETSSLSEPLPPGSEVFL